MNLFSSRLFSKKQLRIYFLAVFIACLLFLTNCQSQYSHVKNLHNNNGDRIVVLGDIVLNLITPIYLGVR